MSLTFEAAWGEMLTLFKAEWDATTHPVFYESVEKDKIDATNPYIIPILRHADGRQATLGGTGVRRFVRNGLLLFRLFTPVGNGLQESYQLAKVVVDAFEGKSSPGGVWFRNTRINEIGRDGSHYETQIMVEFEYDEIK